MHSPSSLEHTDPPPHACSARDPPKLCVLLTPQSVTQGHKLHNPPLHLQTRATFKLLLPRLPHRNACGVSQVGRQRARLQHCSLALPTAMESKTAVHVYHNVNGADFLQTLTCSQNSRSPPGRSTRRTSCKQRFGSCTVQSVHALTCFLSVGLL